MVLGKCAITGANASPSRDSHMARVTGHTRAFGDTLRTSPSRSIQRGLVDQATKLRTDLRQTTSTYTPQVSCRPQPARSGPANRVVVDLQRDALSAASPAPAT